MTSSQINSAYAQGFMAKCAEYGIDGRPLLQKQAGRNWSWLVDLFKRATKAMKKKPAPPLPLTAGATKIPKAAPAMAQLDSNLRVKDLADESIGQRFGGLYGATELSPDDARILAARAKLRANPDIAEHPIIGPRIEALAETTAPGIDGADSGWKALSDSNLGVRWLSDKEARREGYNRALSWLDTDNQLPFKVQLERENDIAKNWLFPTFQSRLEDAIRYWKAANK